MGDAPVDNPLAGTGWEEIGWLEVDAATVAFADASVLRLHPRERLRLSKGSGLGGPVVDLGPMGVPMVAFTTTEDAAYSVEVAKTAQGTIVAARVYLVTDVDELDGTWERAGELEITSGECIATDPFCEGDAYTVRFPVPDARYVVEVFTCEVEGVLDHLGIRMRRT